VRYNQEMTFDEYQKLAITTDVFGGKPQPIDSHAFLSKLLGLVGEAGETAEKFKKIFRDKGGVLGQEDKKEIMKELGDVLWYVSVLCTYLDASLEDVADGNLDKVLGRKARGVSKGSGDNR
jgi:NTP pyrophosphatase (non-canonical NTP hydrolase)